MNNATVKLLIEMGPLLLFFIVYSQTDLYWATGALMIAVTIALTFGWIRERKLSPVPLVTAVVVLVFGGLTLYLQDATFIKMKPTIVNGLFCAVLMGGHLFGKPFMRYVLEAAIKLEDEGWRILNFRWALFFGAMAIINEVVWRSVSEETWVNIKTFGYFPLTIIFSMVQMPVMTKYAIASDEKERNAEEADF